MESTGEPDRKRRQFGPISPTPAAVKKQPFSPLSEDKRIDVAVLQYQNQKLVQKLETQKVEHIALETNFCQLKEKQQPYDETLVVVTKSWEELVDGLESCSIRTKDLMSSGQGTKRQLITKDGDLSPPEDAFLSRLLETGATESSSAIDSLNQEEEYMQTAVRKSKNILCNIVAAIDDLWCSKNGLLATVMEALPEYGSCRQQMSIDFETEVWNLRLTLGDLCLKHKSLARELQFHRDTDAKNKAKLKRLRVELADTIAKLEESNCKLATLKSERAATKGAFFPVISLASRPVAIDRTKDKRKGLQEMESSLKELLDQASGRLLDLKCLHEERIEILRQLSSLQNTLKNMKCISSSQPYVLLKEQLAKSKSLLVQYQALFEKLQAEKDNLAWWEKVMDMKNDLLDIFHRNSVVADFRMTELGIEIQKQINERNLIETKLEEASREPGRKDIIAEFKSLVSSFPEDMDSMQSQLSKYKVAASDVHSLRAEVQSLSTVLDRKVKELETLYARSSEQVGEMQKLQALVCDLRESDLELKLVLEMYRFESTNSRDVLETRDSEYKVWAHVQSLTSSLDEHNLELRVKTAIEAEAISQQRLAAAEAEIADLRRKLEASKREKLQLSDALKSKCEENEAYLSEIETIGQAYDDMQTQNQHHLWQITESDDYNIKLTLEGLWARQFRDAVLMEKQTTEKAIQQANASVDFSDMKSEKIEDQLKMWSDQLQKLAEDKFQSLSTMENIQKKLLDVWGSSQQLRESLDKSQFKVEKSRVSLAELKTVLEKERFGKRRFGEELEVVRRKASCLSSHMEESSVVEKLQQELGEYREILKCSICLDRLKEVVITKCYHLFCNPCIQRIIDMHHRKCPVCSGSFGGNDVKPVYI